MRFTRSFLACVLSALIIAQGSLTSIFTIQDTFASTPSSSGTAGGANPLVVSSGLNKQNVNGLKDLKFSDLFTG